jgi:hypothetical protein
MAGISVDSAVTEDTMSCEWSRAPEATMHSRVLRCLILVGSFNLVLPPGWCCIFQAFPAAGENKAAEPKVPTCCGHCKLATQAKTRCQPEPQPPSPDPVAPGECPCTERQTTLAHVFKISMQDLSLAVLLVAFDAVPCWTSITREFDLPCFHSDLSLQIIYCAWLC